MNTMNEIALSNAASMNDAVTSSHLSGMNDMLVILAFVLLAGNVLFSAVCGENLWNGLLRTLCLAAALGGMWWCFWLGALL